MELEPGTLLRVTSDPSDIWKVTRISAKSVWMGRCDAKGDFGPYDPKIWVFRRPSVLRDFHPA
jgi:hypothetical protein